VSIYKKTRLDQLLVDSGLAATRSRAADLVRRGAVSVEGVAVLKPGALVRPDAALAVESGAFPYVSRGGLKLAAALDAFGFSPEGRVALDLGASTGGFTDVLPLMSAAISSTRRSVSTSAWWRWRGPTQGASMPR
jgi:23S rRNA (cytidine1920-2'-O)/16S rRNA (cytidine1409-2'-O)-methyltransferase